MKFKYTTTMTPDTKGRLVKRPLIELEIMGKEKNAKAFGLIDSGADTTLINIEYAKRIDLSLDSRKTKSYIGINGPSVICYLSVVPIKVRYFAEPINVSVGFIDSPAVDILLGQEDFFEQFKIKLERDHDTFELSATNK